MLSLSTWVTALQQTGKNKQGRIHGHQLRTGWAGAEMRIFPPFNL